MRKPAPMHFVDDLSKPGRAILQVGTTRPPRTMFYAIWDMDDSGVGVERWRREIPESLSLVEGEYYALQRGLQSVLDGGYTEVMILTGASPICFHLEVDRRPSSELTPYYDAIQRKLEEFDYVDYRGYTSI